MKIRIYINLINCSIFPCSLPSWVSYFPSWEHVCSPTCDCPIYKCVNVTRVIVYVNGWLTTPQLPILRLVTYSRISNLL